MIASQTTTSSSRAATAGGALNWDRDGRDWPHRSASRFVRAAGLEWHVQVMGAGPPAVLVHGTAASTHSWRGLAPRLAARWTVVALDLPGHGFSETPRFDRLSLPAMAAALGELLQELALAPELAVGHSAGAAILARMTIDGAITPKRLVSLNGAFIPFRGMPGVFFAPVAKMMAASWLVPQAFSWFAQDRRVLQRLIDDTGSRLDAEGIALYRRLLGNPSHVAAALGMMANWDLDPLLRDLPLVGDRLALIAAGDDRTISPLDAVRVRDRVPGARLEYLRGLGHLAHEERPDIAAELISRLFEEPSPATGADR